MKKKHFLVVGGTQGIGRNLVQLLSDQGHEVSVIARKPPVEKDGAFYWSVDLLDSKKLTKTLSEIIKKNGTINGLVFFQRYRDGKDSWSGEIETSLSATKSVIEFLVPHFNSQEASVVLVGSVNSHLIAKRLPVGYHIAKAGLVQLARYYAVLLGPKGIRVNCVSPGTILKNESKDFYLKNKSLTRFYKTAAPLGRMGSPNEVAEIVSFLCSEKSSLITGQEIIADGGVSLQWQESLASTGSEGN